MKFLSFSILSLLLGLAICISAQAKIIELFEDDPKFLDKLTGQDTPTTITNDDKEKFMGEISLKLETPAAPTNGQRYSAVIAGWTYSITNKPAGDDEARWIMFVWKKDAGEGIMIQFPSNGAWGVQPQGGRYFDGINKAGWAGIQLADEAPRDWEVQIRDLFDDFGEFTLTGVALTQYDNIGYYDSIYLAWTEDELNKMVKEFQAVEPQEKLTTMWGQVKSVK